MSKRNFLDNLKKEGNLLNNEIIVIFLNSIKTQAEDNTKKFKEAEEKKIKYQKRAKYLPFATLGSVLYFSIVLMQEISKMYSASLNNF